MSVNLSIPQKKPMGQKNTNYSEYSSIGGFFAPVIPGFNLPKHEDITTTDHSSSINGQLLSPPSMQENTDHNVHNQSN